MVKDWTKDKIGNLCLVGDGAHASIKRVEQGIPYLTSKNFNQSGLVLEKVDYISESDYEKHFKISKKAVTRPKEGDLIFSIIGSIGGAYLYKKSDKFALSSSVAIIRPESRELSSEYLLLYLKSGYLQNWVNGIKSGSAQSFVSLEMIKSLPISYPIIESQRRVTDIVLNYDNLIENNTKRIAILEEMAEQLYKEWFVRMRFPNYQNTKFVKGIPEGWEVKKIREVLSFYIGGGWGKEKSDSEHNVAGYVIRGTDIPHLSKGVLNREVYRYHKASNIKSRVLKPFDLIFEVSGGTQTQLLGRTIMLTEGLLNRFGDKVMCASFCKLMRPNIQAISPYYLDGFLKAYYESGAVGTYQIQSTGICNYQFEDFLNNQTILIPPKTIRESFDSIVAPILNEIVNVGEQNENLRKTRDLLLPRLISGKLQIKVPQPKVEVQEQVIPQVQKGMLAVIVKKRNKAGIPRGVKITAKDTYFLDTIFNVGTGFAHNRWQWGTYDGTIKDYLTNKRDGYFKTATVGDGIKVFELGDEGETLLSDLSKHPKIRATEKAMDALISIYKKLPQHRTSHLIELLNTTCRSIQDTQSLVLSVIREDFKNWKTPKAKYPTKAISFTEKETKWCIDYILRLGWDKKLIKD